MTQDKDKEMQDLLPWLANDTLEGGEREDCAEYANGNLDGRRQLRQWQKLAEHLDSDQHDGMGEDLAWARLSRDLPKPKQSFWKQPINRAQLAAGIAAVMIIGFMLTPGLIPNQKGGELYTTLSSPSDTVVASEEVAIRLALTPMSDDALQEWLAAREAQLVSRSETSGVIVVRVANQSAYSEPSRWQAAPEVRFAERLE